MQRRDRAGVLALLASCACNCLVRGSPSLDGFRRCAAPLSSDPTFDAERALRRLGSLRRGERLAVRRFDDGVRPHLLLAVTPALAPLPGQAAEGALPQLGRPCKPPSFRDQYSGGVEPTG